MLNKKIKDLRKKSNITQEELAKQIGVSTSMVGMYETGARKPSFEVLIKIANYFNVTTDYLLSVEDRLDITTDTLKNVYKMIADGVEGIEGFEHVENISEKDNKYSKCILIPVYGTIPAGTPLEAVEDIQEYEDIPVSWLKGDKQFIALKVKGDSMYPKYLEGDTVIIQLQPDCESGQDCACYINGYNATLKTVFKHGNKIELKPLNPNYPPKTFNHPGEVTILGVVKELRRKLY